MSKPVNTDHPEARLQLVETTPCYDEYLSKLVWLAFRNVQPAEPATLAASQAWPMAAAGPRPPRPH